MAADGSGAPVDLLSTPFNELNSDLSPDGRWIAYQSDESGRFEVYVRPYPDVNGGRWQVSATGGTRPLWGRDGRELYTSLLKKGVIIRPMGGNRLRVTIGLPEENKRFMTELEAIVKT